MKTSDVQKLNPQLFREEQNILLQHPLYTWLETAERVRWFMMHHVFAVWDFMSLLKKLQHQVTGMTIPWMPSEQTTYTRFINEIVLAEESDEDEDGGYLSHFELYLLAMKDVGAHTLPIEQFLQEIKNGCDPLEATALSFVPKASGVFVRHTLDLVLNGQPHEVAASFLYGREGLIPEMFQSLFDEMKANALETKRLNYYLQRHIELDGDEHGPLAEKLLLALCGQSEKKTKEAEAAAQSALRARIALWDGIYQSGKSAGL